MAQDLETIVQRMIDGGESEESIALVIQSFKGEASAEPAATSATPLADASRAKVLPYGRGEADTGEGWLRETPASKERRAVAESDPKWRDARIKSEEQHRNFDSASASEVALQQVLPMLIGPAARLASPLVGPTTRAVGKALEEPLVGGAVGAAEGYRRGGMDGAIYGGAAGAVGGSILGRLMSAAGRIAGGKPVSTSPKSASVPKPVDPMKAGLKEAGKSGRASYENKAASDRMLADMAAAARGTANPNAGGRLRPRTPTPTVEQGVRDALKTTGAPTRSDIPFSHPTGGGFTTPVAPGSVGGARSLGGPAVPAAPYAANDPRLIRLRQAQMDADGAASLPNVTRSRSMVDELADVEQGGGNPKARAHAIGNYMRSRGIQPSGEGVLTNEDIRALLEMLGRGR